MRTRNSSRFVAAVVLAASVVAGADVRAEVIDFKVTNTVDPVFEGSAFGDVGTYRRIDAVATFAIDPHSARGQSIVDLDKVPTQPDGRVHYTTEVVMLQPSDPSQGNGVLFYDVPNRGRNLAFMLLNLSGGAGMPMSAADAGDGHLMAEGYTIVWSGWQAGLGDGIDIALPPAEGVTGLSREEFVFDDAGGATTAALSYPAADLDPAKASLSVRMRPEDPRSTAPGLGFRYLSPTQIEIVRPADLDAGAIYEFVYSATGAVPAGLGFAATSDLVSFLRGSPGHAAASPLDGVQATLALGISQSGRYLRDFIYQGFNADEAGARVFDGAMPHIAGSRKTFTNYRFAQPGRYSREHEDHDFPGDQFPFTYAETTDPLTGRTESILTACAATGTCPKIFHTDTSTEFWQARASLVNTTPDGQPVEMPENVRLYFMSGAPHFTGWSATSAETKTCRFPSNPVSAGPVMRALLAAMTDWVTQDRQPPDSRFPSLEDGSLTQLAALKLPAFAGGSYLPVLNELRVRDHSRIPPGEGAAYPVFVPQLNAYGVEAGGIEQPQIAAPLGAYWGWNIRKAGFAEGGLCGLTGSFIAAPMTLEEAKAGALPAVAEVYGDETSYAALVEKLAADLSAERLLLAADVPLVIDRAKLEFQRLEAGAR